MSAVKNSSLQRLHTPLSLEQNVKTHMKIPGHAKRSVNERPKTAVMAIPASTSSENALCPPLGRTFPTPKVDRVTVVNSSGLPAPKAIFATAHVALRGSHPFGFTEGLSDISSQMPASTNGVRGCRAKLRSAFDRGRPLCLCRAYRQCRSTPVSASFQVPCLPADRKAHV